MQILPAVLVITPYSVPYDVIKVLSRVVCTAEVQKSLAHGNNPRGNLDEVETG